MFMQMCQLLGNPDDLGVVKGLPYDPEIVDFLDAVSEDIMKHPESRQIPGLNAFAFWCRKKHLLQLKEKHPISDDRCGRGMIFHICASNIPGLFAWSMAIGLLMGNCNLVRVSFGQETMRVAEAFCAPFARVLEKKGYRHLADRMAVVTYPKKNETLTIRYSEMADLRIIWGGDAAIEAITGLQCEPMPEDILFPDRTSAALIDAAVVNAMDEDELNYQARLFYDDTYAMDQNACSSPQLIVWRGSEEACRGASERWWRAVLHQLKEYSLSEKQVYDKYSLACELAMQDECEMVQWVDQKLCHIWMRSLPKDWADLKGNSGIFMEYRVENQEALREIDCEKLQTLLVLGIEHDYLQQMVSAYSMKGISRIAAFGQALEMDLIWDGQDLTQKLTESDFFKWSEIYESHVMLVDDRNQSMTYREARLFGEEYFNQVTARSLLMMVTENTIGSVLTYIHALRHNLVPMLLDKKTEKSRLAVIAEKYRPEYVAVPENLEWQPGTKYREKWHTLGYIFYNRDDGEKEEKVKLHRDLALLLSTSGSTGSPKFVKISKLNLQSNTRAIASYLHITENDRPITTLPMSYTYGLSIINSHVYMGATLLLTEYSVMEQTFWNFFLHQQATTFGGVPYTYQMLKFIGFQNMVLPSLKTMTQAGGKLPVELQKIFSAYAKKNHQAFIVMYGQTEATARMSYLPWKDAEQKMGSIGIAIPGGHFALEDGNSGVILESNKTGELIYYGRNVTMGYAVNRESLAAGDENHGRLVTGDLAYRDEEGFYYITGRKKRFVKLLGNRVSLDETEEMLSREFTDMTFACTGTDEQMKVFYVGNRQGDMAISRFLSKKLHLFKKNFVICKIDSIPRNASGKILYEQLKSC